MKTALALLLLIGFASWLWRDAMRAREQAVSLCRQACKERDIQLLDDTVALARARPVLLRGGLRLRRIFEFEVSLDGRSRRTGTITLIGAQVEQMVVPRRPLAEPEDRLLDDA